jgi:hypothetical protein
MSRCQVGDHVLARAVGGFPSRGVVVSVSKGCAVVFISESGAIVKMNDPEMVSRLPRNKWFPPTVFGVRFPRGLVPRPDTLVSSVHSHSQRKKLVPSIRNA